MPLKWTSLRPHEIRLARQSLHMAGAKHDDGLSTAEMADILQLNSARHIRKWEAGEAGISGPADALIRLLLNVPAARRMKGLR